MNKKDLIGGTVPRRGGMNHKVDSTRILERNFEREDAEAFLFCSGCNLYFELGPKEVDNLQTRIGSSFSGHSSDYFETDACPECGGFGTRVEIKEASIH